MAGTIVSVSDPNLLDKINNVVHDCFFDVDDISFDSGRRVLSIEFKREALERSKLLRTRGPLKTWQIPIIQCMLKFFHVASYEINDTEGVGTYDLKEVTFESQSSRIVVKTGIPIQIEVQVSSFEIEIEETDKTVGSKSLNSVFDIRKI